MEDIDKKNMSEEDKQEYSRISFDCKKLFLFSIW